jgi:hypothetical protein
MAQLVASDLRSNQLPGQADEVNRTAIFKNALPTSSRENASSTRRLFARLTCQVTVRSDAYIIQDMTRAPSAANRRTRLP